MDTTSDYQLQPARKDRTGRIEIAIALAGFVALCVMVLTKAAQYLEPDDYAYRASIVALSQGHILLSTAQYDALAKQLTGGIAQWDHLAKGKWISEKNPGYPFFAVVFQWLHVLRVTPLFYGGVACTSLFLGARRWLGRFGGTWAVLLYCLSGAALVFAWRATMPTFTDASLIAAGFGALLWVVLARDASPRRRTLAGVFAFVALEGATFIRYTDVVELIVASLACIGCAAARLVPWRSIWWWALTGVVFVGVVLAFDSYAYGSPLKTGYANGEITFSLSAVRPNLEHVPGKLVDAMPMLVAALVAVGWILVRLVKDRFARRASQRADSGPSREGEAGNPARGHVQDGAVALVLLAGWAGIWALYSAYTWTVQQGQGGGAGSVHVIRFYLPALGLIALLAAWTMVQIPKAVSLPVLAAIVVLAVLSFHTLSLGAVGGGFGGAGGPGGGQGGPQAPGGGTPPGGIGSGGPPGA